MLGRLVRRGEDNGRICRRAVSDPILCAIEDPMVTVFDGSRLVTILDLCRLLLRIFCLFFAFVLFFRIILCATLGVILPLKAGFLNFI